MPIPDEGRAKVFIGYSHQDDVWLERLQVHLTPLERDGLIDRWDHTRIRAGSRWRDEIKSALDAAQVAVLLISADFMASDFIATGELPSLLAAAEKNGLVILPLIISPSKFQVTESLSRFQSVNPPPRPLIGLEKGKQEEILIKLKEDILSALQGPSSRDEGARPTSSHRVSNIPMPRNNYFTGREDILEALHAGFMSGRSTQALGGIGGVGKKQTALEYAYRYEPDYQFVLWGRQRVAGCFLS